MLHPFYDNGSHPSRPPLIMIVKWKGYGPEYNSWEPGRDISKQASDTLADYWDEVAALQATQPEIGTDTGLAPGAQTRKSSRSLGGSQSRGLINPKPALARRRRR